MPGWDGYPVREPASAERYGAPVWVDNDVNLLAHGRVALAASPSGHENVVVVKVGTGHRRRDHLATAGCIAARRAVPATSATSRSSTTRPSSAAAATSAASRRWPAALRSRATGEAAAREGRSARLRVALEQRGSRDGRGRRAGRVVRRPGRGRRCCRTRAGASARCSPAIVNFFNPSLIVDRRRRVTDRRSLLAAIREAFYRRSLPLATRDLLIQRSSLGGLRGRHRRVGDGRRPALRARVHRTLGDCRRARSTGVDDPVGVAALLYSADCAHPPASRKQGGRRVR